MSFYNQYFILFLLYFKTDVNKLEMKRESLMFQGELEKMGLFDLEREDFGVRIGELFFKRCNEFFV